MRSVLGAIEVNHTIDAGKGGTATLAAVGIKFLLGEDITTALCRETVSNSLGSPQTRRACKLRRYSFFARTSQENDTIVGIIHPTWDVSKRERRMRFGGEYADRTARELNATGEGRRRMQRQCDRRAPERTEKLLLRTKRVQLAPRTSFSRSQSRLLVLFFARRKLEGARVATSPNKASH